jgi:hypothetical protein
MSYDLSIYFPQAAFPAKSWDEILAYFSGSDCEICTAGPSCAEAGVNHGHLLVNTWSLVSIGIASLKHDRGACAPPASRWVATISTGLGRALPAWWIQFAIPYHALVLIPGITVHDCQHHKGSTTEGSSFTDAETWLEFASGRIWDRRARHMKLNGRSLFTEDRRPLF